MPAFDPLDATAGEIAEAVADGRASAGEVCAQFVEHIARLEPAIQAFSHFDADDVLAQARRIDAVAEKGSLAGVPVGVKDIYDTRGMPTEFFSPIYAGNRPSRDAAVVARLRAAGAVVMGKTTTTEFAYMHTGPTRNPHDLSRTPGSSSAGSGAGMAAGFFPLALGSQTAGSLLKPASFCGAFAYKPTARLVSLDGVKPLAPSFDTVGWYGRSVDDLGLVAHVLIPGFPTARTLDRPLRLAAMRTPKLAEVEPAIRERFDAACEALRAAGHVVDEVTPPPGFERIYEFHRTVNDAEGARSLDVEQTLAPHLLSDETRAMIGRAQAASWGDEQAARDGIAALERAMAPQIAGYDALLDLCTAVPALKGLATTGPSDFIKTWMCFGLPQIALPALTSSEGLPMGLQLTSARYRDADLLAVAAAVARVLGCERLRRATLEIS